MRYILKITNHLLSLSGFAGLTTVASKASKRNSHSESPEPTREGREEPPCHLKLTTRQHYNQSSVNHCAMSKQGCEHVNHPRVAIRL